VKAECEEFFSEKQLSYIEPFCVSLSKNRRGAQLGLPKQGSAKNRRSKKKPKQKYDDLVKSKKGLMFLKIRLGVFVVMLTFCRFEC